MCEEMRGCGRGARAVPGRSPTEPRRSPAWGVGRGATGRGCVGAWVCGGVCACGAWCLTLQPGRT